MPTPQSAASSASKSLIDLRVTRRDRDLVDRAAAVLGKNRTEFMLEAARRAAAAEDAVLDRTLFWLDPERFDCGAPGLGHWLKRRAGQSGPRRHPRVKTRHVTIQPPPLTGVFKAPVSGSLFAQKLTKS